MKVLMLSTDEGIFTAGSPAQQFALSYGTLFEELHIIIATHRVHAPVVLAHNVYLYSAGGWFKPFYFFTALWRGRRILSHPGEWLVTSQEAMTNVVAVPLATMCRARLQVQLHTDFASLYFAGESLKNRLRAYLYRWGIRRADCVRAVSERVAAAARTIAPRTPVTVLPIYVDLPAFAAAAGSSINLHARYPQFNFIVLMISRLTPEKDYPTALRAFKRLLPHFPKAGLVIVGDGPLRIKLKALASRMRIRNHVMFVGWQSSVADYLTSADAYLLTSRYEGYGRSLVEAAASGKAIVTTEVGIAGEWLMHNESALVCPVRDKECLGQALVAVAGDNALRKRLGLTAKQAARSHAGISFAEYLERMRQAFAVCAIGPQESDPAPTPH